MTDNPHNRRQINEQTKQDHSKAINNIKTNLWTHNKTNQEVDFFITGPGMEANREVSAKTAKYTKNMAMYSLQLLLQRHFVPTG